jgi:hypothetical protein
MNETKHGGVWNFCQIIHQAVAPVISRCYILAMKHLRKKTSMKEQLETAIDEIGGEPLEGSGFESEKPEEGFSGGIAGPSTYLPGKPRAFRSDLQ